MAQPRGIRINVYLKDPEVLGVIAELDNKSEYIERAIMFYIDNKDVIPSIDIKLTTLLSKINNIE